MQAAAWLPIANRELRAESRKSYTYFLRMAGAAIGLLTVFSVALHASHAPAFTGALVFSRLNAHLFVAIWILVPLLTADSISRERREGTLGLLFLTPLRASGIVFGKVFAQGIRAFTLFAAILPVAILPHLLGGVGW